MIKKRYFSLQQAESILPEVKLLLEVLMKIQLAVHLKEGISVSYDDPFREAYAYTKRAAFHHKQSYRFLKILQQLMKLGVFVKNPGTGLIDFYAKHQGKDIFLCYQYPEESISYWHGMHEGYQGRKHISLLKEEIQK